MNRTAKPQHYGRGGGRHGKGHENLRKVKPETMLKNKAEKYVENDEKNNISINMNDQYPFQAFSFIRLISFAAFKRLRTFPRYPDNKDITICLSDFTKEQYNHSIFIFISHCWLRGWPGAKGWDGRPHPDNVEGGKYSLCVEGIELVLQSLTDNVKDCYIWLDFGCIDQDGDPAGELRMLDKIVEVCDCIFTPIYDDQPHSWEIQTTTGSWYEDYKSIAWRGTPYSYLNRGWCRVEMFYGSNIPVLPDEASRLRHFKAGLLYHRKEKRRPHILYGSKQRAVNYGLILLPPLQNSFYERYSPISGEVSVEKDRRTIARLVQELEPYMPKVQERYEGMVNPQGDKHGQGRYFFSDGSSYEGDWHRNQISGKGKYNYADGSIYEGDWKKGNIHGYGKYIYADGDVYLGHYQNGQMHGTGKMVSADGDIYEGEYVAGEMQGYGVYFFANGDRYEGYWKKGQKHGQGKESLANGAVYEGPFVEGQRQGKGRYTHPNGSYYEGEYFQGLRQGRGKSCASDGGVYEGEWKEDQRDGRGRQRLADGSCYEGGYQKGRRHGKGRWKTKEGKYFLQDYGEGVLLCEKETTAPWSLSSYCILC